MWYGLGPRLMQRLVQVLARRMRLEGTFDFAAVAAKTPGYVGADLSALTKEAGAHAISRVFSSMKADVKVSKLIYVTQQCIVPVSQLLASCKLSAPPNL